MMVKVKRILQSARLKLFQYETLLLRYQRLKYFVHFWFGRVPYDVQLGGYVLYGDTSEEAEALATNMRHMVATLIAVRGEIIGKGKLICIPAMKVDPLRARHSMGWKCNTRIHTRKSWNAYIERLIKQQIKLRESKL